MLLFGSPNPNPTLIPTLTRALPLPRSDGFQPESRVRWPSRCSGPAREAAVKRVGCKMSFSEFKTCGIASQCEKGDPLHACTDIEWFVGHRCEHARMRCRLKGISLCMLLCYIACSGCSLTSGSCKSFIQEPSGHPDLGSSSGYLTLASQRGRSLRSQHVTDNAFAVSVSRCMVL